MAIKLIANYSKRLGLPGYSSHQFSISIESELVTTDDVPGESARIYELLQTSVDEQIQTTGFVPPADYGMTDSQPAVSPSGNFAGPHNGGRWKCSDKQRELILKLVDEHSLDKREVDHLARQRFGKPVRDLGKMEASGLIDELLEIHGTAAPPKRRNAYAGAGKGGGR